jgi:hypothetical protein
MVVLTWFHGLILKAGFVLFVLARMDEFQKTRNVLNKALV